MMSARGEAGNFEGFRQDAIAVEMGATLRVRIGSSGGPPRLLHGNPQTHGMWHRVAPALAERFTVVYPDLQGYGLSSKRPRRQTTAPIASVRWLPTSSR